MVLRKLSQVFVFEGCQFCRLFIPGVANVLLGKILLSSNVFLENQMTWLKLDTLHNR